MSTPMHSGGAETPEQEELRRLRAELAQLQQERDAAVQNAAAQDSAAQKGTGAPGSRPPGSGGRAVRWTAVILLLVLTAVLALVSVPSLYLRTQLLNTDRYLATVAPLASDPAVQAEVTNKVTDQITGAVDIEGITSDALAELGNAAPRVAPLITGLAPVITDQTINLIHSTVARFVSSQQFQDLWIQVNRTTHQGLVNAVNGDTGGSVSIDDNGTVTISTQQIIAKVKDNLVQQGVGIASRIPDVNGQITVFQSPELARALNAIRLLDLVAPALAWLTVASAAGAVAVAPRGRRRRATGLAGLVIAAGMAVLALAIAVGRIFYLNAIPPDGMSTAAAGTIFDTLMVPLRTSLRLVFVVALLIALAAFLTGRSSAALMIRHGFAQAGDYLTGKIGAGQARPWQVWLARYRRILEITVLGIAVLVLIFWQYPTAAVALWTAILAVLVILVIELLSRPAHTLSASPPSPDGDGGGAVDGAVDDAEAQTRREGP